MGTAEGLRACGGVCAASLLCFGGSFGGSFGGLRFGWAVACLSVGVDSFVGATEGFRDCAGVAEGVLLSFRGSFGGTRFFGAVVAGLVAVLEGLAAGVEALRGATDGLLEAVWEAAGDAVLLLRGANFGGFLF